jgi:hypothetical protein
LRVARSMSRIATDRSRAATKMSGIPIIFQPVRRGHVTAQHRPVARCRSASLGRGMTSPTKRWRRTRRIVSGRHRHPMLRMSNREK